MHCYFDDLSPKSMFPAFGIKLTIKHITIMKANIDVNIESSQDYSNNTVLSAREISIERDLKL